ncbi:MAG: type II toxin-antitoxin system HicA family toxin [Nanoarchaeota archaeon]|nr:type II toxin-antitoxin system HicA family toxin [Nanoarchaeota archaeon]MBU1135863.1 type II toxin-antitoxin system HicA family toxin [Nanoarchaeota archaeon]MBU2519835.1 type II toxin-antitoxin system HicA family toxin [Nanoarchaeota archaeon]
MKLPVLSANEIIKALSSVGFSVSRQSGSHFIMVKKERKEKVTVVVPKHRELAKGTLLSIISQSGMSKEDFIKLVRKH